MVLAHSFLYLRLLELNGTSGDAVSVTDLADGSVTVNSGCVTVDISDCKLNDTSGDAALNNSVVASCCVHVDNILNSSWWLLFCYTHVE